MFVIVYSYIHVSILLRVVLKYGAGKVEKIHKSNVRDSLKLPFLKFDQKVVNGSLTITATHRLRGALEKKKEKNFFDFLIRCFIALLVGRHTTPASK